jgi:hypothetical protein
MTTTHELETFLPLNSNHVDKQQQHSLRLDASSSPAAQPSRWKSKGIVISS